MSSSNYGGHRHADQRKRRRPPPDPRRILGALTTHFRPQDELSDLLVVQAARVLSELDAGSRQVAGSVDSILHADPAKAA